MRNCPVQILSAVDTATVTGSAFYVGQGVAASFVATFLDVGANGTVKIQGSNEISIGAPSSYVPSSASFSDITGATSTIASGVGPAIVLATMNFQYIRAVYTRTSGGSTTFTVNMSYLGVP